MQLSETQYFPPIHFFAAQFKEGLQLERYEHYQKRSFRNKCLIASPQGVQHLTIPLLKGKNERLPITQVQISYHENWPRKHLQAIRSAYGRAPYFEHYIPHIEALLLAPGSGLFDFNLTIIHVLLSLLTIEVPLKVTDQYQSNIPSKQDLRNKYHPRNYTQYPMDPYPQVFEDRHGFLPNLSILDLLFCQGPAARIML